MAEQKTGERTEFRCAERLIEWYGHELRYCATWAKWLVWDGKRWALDHGAAETRERAKATLRRLLASSLDVHTVAVRRCADAIASGDQESAQKGKEELDRVRGDLAHAIKSQAARTLSAMLAIAASDPKIAVSHADLDADPMLFNAANGTLNLETGQLRPHAQADLITKVSPVAFDPVATAPKWTAFLEQMQPDTSMRDFLQRAIGYAMSGTIREHVLFFSYGKDGANGKSTFHETILFIMGEYGGVAARKLIFKSGKGNDRHPTEVADLVGKRYVRLSEIEEGQHLDEALIKDLTGGDRISARRMHEDFWSFAPSHKLFIAGNHKPTVRGDDGGIWRRMRLIPWDVTVAPAEQNEHLSAELRAEAPGILAWALAGCRAWLAGRLDTPETVTSATATYRRENDTLGQFFTSYLEFGCVQATPRKTIRELYEHVCEEVGEIPLGAKRFSARLREMGANDTSVRFELADYSSGQKKMTSKVMNGWKGVRLLSEQERHLRSERKEDSEPATDARRHVGTCSDRFQVTGATLRGGISSQGVNGTYEVPTAYSDDSGHDAPVEDDDEAWLR